MGDRAVIQLRTKDEMSPCLYMHNSGDEVAAILKRTHTRMEGRGNDVSYAFARLVQEAIGDSWGCLSFGVWNQTELLTESDTHGDAGVFVVDVSDGVWRVYAGGGYAFEGKDVPEGLELCVLD
jgi:hypothetical protein